MANEFWDGYQNGYAAVHSLKKGAARRAYAQTGRLNDLMAVDPEEAQQLQLGQQRNALFDQQQADRQRQQALTAGRSQILGGLVQRQHASAQPSYMMGQPQGLLAPGNIDINHRPTVHNPDGSISTVKSMSIGEDGREVLIPMVSDDGRMMDEQQAVDMYHQTGRNLGAFDNPDDATAYAQSLHQQQEQMYGQPDASIGERQALAAAGDYEGLTQYDTLVKNWDARTKAAADQKADEVGMFYYGLSQIPDGPERQQWAQANAQQYGLDPATIIQHVGDNDVRTHLGHALGLKEALKRDDLNAQRAAAQSLRDQQLEEQRRYHNGQLQQGQARTAAYVGGVANSNHNRNARTGIAQQAVDKNLTVYDPGEISWDQ